MVELNFRLVWLTDQKYQMFLINVWLFSRCLVRRCVMLIFTMEPAGMPIVGSCAPSFPSLSYDQVCVAFSDLAFGIFNSSCPFLNNIISDSIRNLYCVTTDSFPRLVNVYCKNCLLSSFALKVGSVGIIVYTHITRRKERVFKGGLLKNVHSNAIC